MDLGANNFGAGGDAKPSAGGNDEPPFKIFVAGVWLMEAARLAGVCCVALTLGVGGGGAAVWGGACAAQIWRISSA